jgi:hypothetical protein
VAKAALLMMATIAVSRILGYGREVALYTMFGQNYMLNLGHRIGFLARIVKRSKTLE